MLRKRSKTITKNSLTVNFWTIPLKTPVFNKFHGLRSYSRGSCWAAVFTSQAHTQTHCCWGGGGGGVLTCVQVGSIQGCCVRWCPGGQACRWAPRGQTATGTAGCRSACLGGCLLRVRADCRLSDQTDLHPGGRGSSRPSGPWSRCSWGPGSPAEAGRSRPEPPARGKISNF